MTDKTNEIQAVENKYGVFLFRTGLTQLFDIGMRNMTAEYAQAAIEQIERESAEAEEQGNHVVMSPDFKKNIIHCARDLTAFSIWELLSYVKKHVNTN